MVVKYCKQDNYLTLKFFYVISKIETKQKSLEYAMINKRFKLDKNLYFYYTTKHLSERFQADESHCSAVIDLTSTFPRTSVV